MSIGISEAVNYGISPRWYLYISGFVLCILLVKMITSKEELFEEVDQIRKMNETKLPRKELELLCFTRLNTRINRDYLEQSMYYVNKGYSKIYGSDRGEGSWVKSSKESRVKVRGKKVSFSDKVLACDY